MIIKVNGWGRTGLVGIWVGHPWGLRWGQSGSPLALPVAEATPRPPEEQFQSQQQVQQEVIAAPTVGRL